MNFDPLINKAIQEILKEDANLRNDFYSILDSIMKSLAHFTHPKASKFREYFNFKKMLKDFADLPKNGTQDGLSKSEVATTPPSLSIDDLRIAALIRLLPLKLSTFEKKIKKELKYLRATDSDFIIMIFLEHILDLLKNSEFRELVVTRKAPIIIDPKIKNSR